jgi:zinc transporter ZupT
MENAGLLVTVILLAGTFILGGRLKIGVKTHRRRWLSVAAGISTAYVFVQLFPEMFKAQEVFTKATAGGRLPFAEQRVYTSALAGFILLYGLEHLVAAPRQRRREERVTEGKGDLVYYLHIGGFAIYGGLVSYLMVDEGKRGLLFLILYFVAMFLHFLGADHSLRREHGRLYDRSGKWVLAGAVLTGWVAGSLSSIPETVLATLQGFVGGGVVINSMIMELPKENDGRFWPFCGGALGYALIILLIG